VFEPNVLWLMIMVVLCIGLLFYYGKVFVNIYADNNETKRYVKLLILHLALYWSVIYFIEYNRVDNVWIVVFLIMSAIYISFFYTRKIYYKNRVHYDILLDKIETK